MKHLNFFFYFILVVFLSACSSGSEDIPNPSPIPEPTGEYIPKTLGSSAILTTLILYQRYPRLSIGFRDFILIFLLFYFFQKNLTKMLLYVILICNLKCLDKEQ